jgi:hypothetical protein
MNHKKIFIICVILSLSLFSCKKNSTQNKPIEIDISEVQNKIKEQKNVNEKIIEILKEIETEKNGDQILPYEYIYFYGKTKDEIINKLGNDYIIVDHEEIPEEYGWGYTKREKIQYSGITFGILLSSETSIVDYFEINNEKIRYVGNIFVGCSIDDVINQLGKPTIIDIVVNNFIYFSQNIKISFKITHEKKIKNIFVSDYSESYNLDFNPKD